MKTSSAPATLKPKHHGRNAGERGQGGNEGGGYCLTNSRTEREPPGVSPCLRSRVWYSSKKKIIQGCGGVAPAWEVTTLGEGQKL